MVVRLSSVIDQKPVRLSMFNSVSFLDEDIEGGAFAGNTHVFSFILLTLKPTQFNC